MECRCRDAQDKYVMQMHDAHSELFGGDISQGIQNTYKAQFCLIE